MLRDCRSGSVSLQDDLGETVEGFDLDGASMDVRDYRSIGF